MSLAERHYGLPKIFGSLAAMEESNVKRFGRIVRERREHLGLQQTELKDRNGPSSTTMSAVERGLREKVTPLVLRRLDAGLDWTPGSAARTLAGGDPTPLSPEADEFLGKMRHPRYAGGIQVALDRQDADLLSVLEELLVTGQLPANAQEQLERLRDDAVIDQFPKRFEALTRGRKLRVARFGFELWVEQQEAEEEGHANTSPNETQPSSSETVDQNEEVKVSQQPEVGTVDEPPVGDIMGTKSAGEDPREDGPDEGDKTEEFGGGEIVEGDSL